MLVRARSAKAGSGGQQPLRRRGLDAHHAQRVSDGVVQLARYPIVPSQLPGPVFGRGHLFGR